MRNVITRAVWVALGVSVMASARDARATSVLEVPDNGSEQMGRGGAWVARASDPLATFFNPAGLAGQDTRLTLQANVNIMKTCFTRTKDPNTVGTQQGDPQSDGVQPGSAYAQVCSDAAPFPNPQLAFAYKINPRLGLGIAVVGPSAAGNQTWPDNGPQRFLLTSAKTVVITPTVGVGWEPVDNWRLGLGLLWGIASVDFANSSYTSNSAGSPEVKAEVKAKKLFIPGFTAGTIWSPAPNVDIAAWYKWQSPIDAKGDVYTTFVEKGVGGGTFLGDSSQADCGTPGRGYTCSPGLAHVKIAVPMEAKLGVRYHKPRPEVAQAHRRDPLSQDVFDVEADLTWANNSAIDNIGISLPGDATGAGLIPAQLGPLPGQVLPPDNDVPHQFKDVFGVRVGGDYNLLPGRLAVRLGGYFETSAAKSQYANVDFAAGSRVGLAAGATYRATEHVELMAGLGHTFISSLTNQGPSGVYPIAGLDCWSGSQPVPNTQTCQNGYQRYRYPFAANLGTFTNAFTAINLGVSYRF